MFCEKCGYNLPEGTKVCPSCGYSSSALKARVVPSAQPTSYYNKAAGTQPTSVKSSKKGCSGPGCLFIIFAFIVVVGLFSLPRILFDSATGGMGSDASPTLQHLSGWLFDDDESGYGGLSTGTPSQQSYESDGSNDTWTILMYICGSDLESGNGYATYDLREIQDANIGSNVNVVVEAGGTARWQNNVFDSSYINRAVLKDSRFQLVDRVKLASMGKASTLSDYLEWGTKNYPADHYMLLIWNHGGGTLYGVCMDKVFYEDMLTVGELRDGIEASGARFDVVGFDTCLMSTFETASALSPYVKYMIASEETISGAGWEYTSWLSWLSANAGKSGSELGKTICDTYMNACKWYGLDGMATLSCIDLSKIAKLKKALNKVGSDFALATTEKRNLKALAQAAKSAESYGDNDYNMIDMYDFVQKASDVQTEDHAQTLLKAIDDAVVYNIHGRNRKGAHGLSIFYPFSVNKGEFDNFMAVAPSQSYAQMAAAIAGYYNSYDWPEEAPIEEEEAEPVTKEDVEIEYTQRITKDGYLRLQITNGLDDVASVEFQLSYMIGDPKNYSMVYLGSDNNIQADWDRGVFTDNFNGKWMSINGTYVCAELIDSRDGYNLYSIPAKINGTQMSLRASYDFNTEKYTIIDAYETADNSSGAAGKSRPLRDGDVITFLFTKTPNGAEASDLIELGTITWSNDIEMTDEDLGDGLFVYCFRITDVFGVDRATESVVVEYENGEIALQTMEDWMSSKM